MRDDSGAAEIPVRRRPASAVDYLAMARLDHLAKHVFVVPGAVLAYLLRGVRTDWLFGTVALGATAVICVASANYVANEWLDRDSDRHHPTKSARSAVQADVSPWIVYAEWTGLLATGIAAAFGAGFSMGLLALAFGVQGVVYNVRPFRSKDVAYMDVVSESVNNPLRLMIGWAMVDPTSLPPSSVILLYWTGGAFLMAAKRLSEYREIVRTDGFGTLVRYRASFSGYDDVSLTLSCFVYALCSTFFLAVFTLKYRVEYLLTAPFVVGLFVAYMRLAMTGSTAQRPERLYRERVLVLLVASLAATFVVASVVDVPLLDDLTRQRFIGVP